MDNIIKDKNCLRINVTFIISLSMIATLFVSPSLISQKSFAEDYKLDISIKNEENVDTKTDLSIKTEDDKVETTVDLKDDTEKIKETISGEPGDEVEVCLDESDDNSKYCQTKDLPKDEDSTLKFELEYKD
jgi:hypothetical protein